MTGAEHPTHRTLTVSTTEMSELAVARSSVYRALSTIYIQAPNQHLLETLMDGSRVLSVGSLAQSNTLPNRLLSGMRAIGSFTAELNSDLVGKLTDALSVEYTRLLRGVKPSYSPPPPYESVHLGEGMVLGENTMAVRKEYNESGFSLAEHHRGEPPDHISFELEFMQFLCTREAKAWRKEDQNEAQSLLSIEKRFLEKHLAKWAPKFCETIRRYDKLGFYRGWADVTEGWISFDSQLIKNCRTSSHIGGVPTSH